MKPTSTSRPGGLAVMLRSAAEERVVIPVVFLVVILSVFAATTPGALSPSSLRYSVFNASLALVLAASGLALVVLAGGLDLSSAGVIAAVNAVLTVHYGGGLASQSVWLVAVIAGAALFGAANGYLVHRFQLEPVVVTLASGFILTGAALLVLPDPAGLKPVAGTSLVLQMTSTVGGVPVSLLVILAVAVLWILARRSRLGTYLMAVGGDREGAAYSGVPVGRTHILVFAMAGALYGLAGVAVTSQTSGGDSTLGSSFLLASFAAVVVGGVRLGGGLGSLLGVICGSIALTVSVGVLLALGFDTYWSTIARGGLLLLAIGAQAVLVLALRRVARRAAPIATGDLA